MKGPVAVVAYQCNEEIRALVSTMMFMMLLSSLKRG